MQTVIFRYWNIFEHEMIYFEKKHVGNWKERITWSKLLWKLKKVVRNYQQDTLKFFIDINILCNINSILLFPEIIFPESIQEVRFDFIS